MQRSGPATVWPRITMRSTACSTATKATLHSTQQLSRNQARIKGQKALFQILAIASSISQLVPVRGLNPELPYFHVSTLSFLFHLDLNCCIDVPLSEFLSSRFALHLIHGFVKRLVA